MIFSYNNNRDKSRILNLVAGLMAESDESLDSIVANGPKADLSTVSDQDMLYIMTESLNLLMILDDSLESVRALAYYSALNQIMQEKNAFDINNDVQLLDTIAKEKALDFATRVKMPKAKELIQRMVIEDEFNMAGDMQGYWGKSNIERMCDGYNRYKDTVQEIAKQCAEQNFAPDHVEKVIEENSQDIYNLCKSFGAYSMDGSESFADVFAELLKDMSAGNDLDVEFAKPRPM